MVVILGIMIVITLLALLKSLKLYVSFLSVSAVLMDRGLEPTLEEQKRAIAFVLVHRKKDFRGFVKGWLRI